MVAGRGRGRPRGSKNVGARQGKRWAPGSYRVMRRKYGIPSRTHLIKRLAEPVFIQNDSNSGAPSMTHTGTDSFAMGAVQSGTLPSTYEYGMAGQFQLNSVIDSADLTSLFDRYRIVGVALKVHYLATGGSSYGTASLPTIHYAYDFDDGTAPLALQTVITKAYCKTRVLNANNPLKIYVKPRLAKEIFSGVAGTAYSSEKACWLDCASSAIPHYGIKFWITEWQGGQENNNALRIQPVYYLALKDTQ